MADYLIQESTLDAIADAINAKTGGSSAMTPAEMVTAIRSISTADILQYIKALGIDGMRHAVLPENTIFPALTTTAQHSLNSISGCKNLALPAITTLGLYVVTDSNSLEKLDLGNSCPNITGVYTFSGNPHFNTLIIRKTTLVSLGNINNLGATGFADGYSGGILYVPSNLVSSYQSATNWSTLLEYQNNQILPIEGSIYETQYVDGTPIQTT